MGQKTILDLNQYGFYELLKQIKKNCEKTNPYETLEEIKYRDFINFIGSCKQFEVLFYKWDKVLYRRLFIPNLTFASHVYIHFDELYTRLKSLTPKVKETYYKSVYLAIKENVNLKTVELKYHAENYHSEHMEVFSFLMNELRKKKSIEVLKLHIPVYTIDDLSGFGSLIELILHVRVDVEDLCRCCSNNRNLRKLTVLNDHMMGRRLADIAPHCSQVRRFTFLMKPECDALEYAPLAKMSMLEQLKICGVHEPGTLKPLFQALANRQSEAFRKLSIDNALLNFEDTTALSQIKLLRDLRCGFVDPQSFEPISKLFYLEYLEVLSEHDFRTISQQMCRILEDDQWKKKILFKDCYIDYNSKGHLGLVLNNVHASDYGGLLTVPHLKSLEINGVYKPGSLVELFKMLDLVKLPSLTINTLKPFTSDYEILVEKGWKLRSQIVPTINAEETLALSTCRELKNLVCGFSDTTNIHLLQNLIELKELVVTTKPSNGSLRALFSALASEDVSCLQSFRLSSGTIDSLEAEELSRIKSLKKVECGFVDPRDIEKFSDLASESLEELIITSSQNFHETSHGILKVLQSSEKKICFSTKDILINADRRVKFIGLQMSIFESYTDDTLLVPIASVKWVEHLRITLKRGSLSYFFNSLSLTNNHLKKIEVFGGSLGLHETQELVNLRSLKELHGTFTNSRSFEHLRHLVYIGIGGKRFPENMVDIFDSIEEELTISVMKREISYNNKTGRLTLCDVLSLDFSIVSTNIASLACLKDLKSVRIVGNYYGRSLQLFLANLASKQTLQEVIVESEKDEMESSVLTLSSIELEEVTAMKSLRTLKCGFDIPEDLEMLSTLPELTCLVIGLNKVDVLKSLLGKISLNNFSVPNQLPSEGIISFEIRPQQIFINELIISKNKGDTYLVGFLQFLNLASGSMLKKLIIKGSPIEQREADEISKMESLQKLYYRFSDLQDIKSLLKLSELTTLIIGCRSAPMMNTAEYEEKTLMSRVPDHILQELMPSYFKGSKAVAYHLDRQRLVIELPREVYSLKAIFDPMPEGYIHTLQELVITYRYLDIEEVKSITQIVSLRKLRCGFGRAISFSHLRSLTNLECLEIKSYPQFTEIYDHLVTSLQECRNLQSIDLHFNSRVQLISCDFVERAIQALKLARDPKVRSPLRLSCFVSLVFIEPNVFIDEEFLNLSINKLQKDEFLWIYYETKPYD
ncbi:uncharacterized protein LOC26536100 [Drosophila yakuba]|uniref:Uncharacterized protein n=1 Tax=Drosophila yakuba TaxID=7245 RepID=A0A0R1DK05_DROYA|nr:uncharacterized protein LOC26536100 [Drosophila yakuba]XP_039226944.1 uncharacterized protein LOC26536100 [Drosophila yakuba]KRJ97567.1 uncharacterized protein Dyak_GE28919 [Drosophila yakuba]